MGSRDNEPSEAGEQPSVDWMFTSWDRAADIASKSCATTTTRFSRLKYREDRKRHMKQFVSKLNGFTKQKHGETQTSGDAADAELALCTASELRHTYDQIIGKLVNMISHPDPWILRRGTE